MAVQDSLEKYGACRKSLELFDLVVQDMEQLREMSHCRRLVSQQIASADSIAANIEEGCGRESREEYIQFLRYARGSARETRGRYLRMKHWLAGDLVESRVEICDEIIGTITKTITTLRNKDD